MSLIVDLMMKNRSAVDVHPKIGIANPATPAVGGREISEFSRACESLELSESEAIAGSQEIENDSNPSFQFEKHAVFFGAIISLSVLFVLGVMTWLLVSHRDIGLGISQAAARVSIAKKSAISSRMSMTESPVKELKSAQIARELNEQLEGIILDSKQPVCVIGGNVYGVGDRWHGKTICSIGTRGVLLKDPDGNISSVKLKP